MSNQTNTLEQIRREPRDDARLYCCIKELYEQGVPISDLKALLPDIRRTKEQLQIKRMLENNNEVLMSMISRRWRFFWTPKNVRKSWNLKNWTS